MRVIVCDNYERQCAAGADIIEKIVREKPDCCLGLATGSSPVGMYKEPLPGRGSGFQQGQHCESGRIHRP